MIIDHFLIIKKIPIPKATDMIYGDEEELNKMQTIAKSTRVFYLMAYRQIGGAFFLRNRLDGPQMDTFFGVAPSHQQLISWSTRPGSRRFVSGG